MRSILNISLSKDLISKVESLVKKGRYSTKSEFVRDLIRERVEYQELLKSIKKSEAEFRAGRGKLLRSFEDLDA